MITNQRLVELLDGSEPITQEEKIWLENHYKHIEQRAKEREDYEKRLHASKREFKELFNKYALPEYKKDGLFRTKRFKRIEKHVERKASKQILKMDLDTNTEFSYEFYRLKHKILKDKCCFGESKHQAKQNGTAQDGIYSYSTYHNYQR